MTSTEHQPHGQSPESARAILAVDHLRGFIALLKGSGYTRYKVDELRHPESMIRVRYAYAGGEWGITTIKPDVAPWTVRFDHRHFPLPTLEALVEATVCGSAPADLDATGATTIRHPEATLVREDASNIHAAHTAALVRAARG